MAIAYNKRPFSWRGRSAARAPRRVIVWVEELESRQVLAAVGTTPGNPLLLIQLPKVGPTNPAFVAPVSPGTTTSTTAPTTNAVATPGVNPVTNLTNLTNGKGTIAPFVVGTGQTATSQSLTAPNTTLLQTPAAGTPNGSALITNPGPPLPPILQGVAVVPPSGPLTFADLQTITANFIGGGHTETSPAPNPRPFNPPSTPRPLPSASPNQATSALDLPVPLTAALSHDPLQEAELLVPLIAGFEEGPQLIADQPEEVLQKPDASVGLRVEACATPVLAAALVAHWADRHRRPDEEEK
jgi:hypothetical protein